MKYPLEQKKKFRENFEIKQISGISVHTERKIYSNPYSQSTIIYDDNGSHH